MSDGLDDWVGAVEAARYAGAFLHLLAIVADPESFFVPRTDPASNPSRCARRVAT